MRLSIGLVGFHAVNFVFLVDIEKEKDCQRCMLPAVLQGRVHGCGLPLNTVPRVCKTGSLVQRQRGSLVLLL